MGATVLWLDDEPNSINRIQRFFDAGGYDLKIHIVDSASEAQSLLASNVVAGAVFDLNLDPGDRYHESGADLLVETNERHKYLPTFIYSGWLHDPHYRRILEGKNHAISEMAKTDTFSEPYSNDKFLKAIGANVIAFESVRQRRPERVTFKEYRSGPSAYSEEIKCHWGRFGHYLSIKMERDHLAWVVMCGETIHKSSSNLQDYPSDEELDDIGGTTNLIPFAYSQAYEPEQIEWAQLPKDDYYPTIEVCVEGARLLDDFDTGAVLTHMCDSLVPPSIHSHTRQVGSSHLSRPYEFSTRRVAVDIAGVSSSIPVAAVREWANSPFVRVKAGRRALFGRDLLNALQLRIVLDGKLKSSDVTKG